VIDMRLCFSSVIIVAGLLSGVGYAQNTPEPSAPTKVEKKQGISYFGKITVVGSDQRTRGGISSMAEALRVELNKICNEPHRKLKLPIIIRLHGKRGDAEQKRSVISKIQQVEGQYQLWLHLHLARGVNHQQLRYHLMELFLYERGLGEGQKLADGETVLVKPWLIVGMLEAIDIKHGRADAHIYRAKVPYLEVLPLQKVFDTTEKQWRAMIGHEPLAFRAISGALVNSLLRQPGGRPGMAAFLSEIPTFKGEIESLMRKHFPGMNQSHNSLEKWVTLELLELGTAKITEVQSILETDRRLESILKLRYRNKDGQAVVSDLDAYPDVLKLKPKERFDAVAGARAELERLSYRCFPTYRPLLYEYEMLMRDMIIGKDKEIKTRLNNLADAREKMKQAGKKVRDYLDWYYITQSTDVSGKFSSYNDLIDALEKEKSSSGEHDAISEYLDGMQRMIDAKESP